MSKTNINLKKETSLPLDTAIEKVTAGLKEIGFGVLTRIDFHTKMKEKLNKDLKPLVILGVCNPLMAFEAYQTNSDVTSLMPCNVVVRELENGKTSIEAQKPSSMMEILGESKLAELAQEADKKIQSVLERL